MAGTDHTRKYNSADKRWEAVLSNDENADEFFLYAVVTTGVYCRPSCPSRRPKRENVVFYDTLSDAKENGFRSCKRCQPDIGMQAGKHRR